MRYNCWEVKKCGCEPGGKNSKIFGICPAALETRAHQINGGINGGRACWAISKTLCAGNKAQGTYAQKLKGCLQCDFYQSVRSEEQKGYMSTKTIMAILNELPDRCSYVPTQPDAHTTIINISNS